MSRASGRSLVVLLVLACARPGAATDATTQSSTTGDSVVSTTTTTTPSITSETTTPTTTATTSAPDLGEPTCTDPQRCPPVCDTVLQNCPKGQKCTGVKPSIDEPYRGTACVADNAGQGAPAGGICFTASDGWDNCDADTMCVQFGTGEGACVPFCGGTVDAPACADATLVCARTDRLWPISVCVPPCDPLAYDCPDADIGAEAMVCQPAAVGFGCVLRGNLDGRALGEPCVQHRDCTAAAHCAPPDDVPGCAGPDGCCAAYCDLDAPSCPVAGQTCVAHFAPGEAPPNLEKVGRCAVP
ncbi:hypothetical protein [Nannocystis sp. SCPEA4]|uniref:hypothetical protein n=1 Tax=Nannocystis sp. SCPEA4 TaxID=2996787 RepID=UPI002271D9F3|nr:hypothetical protein [Nannocystis sp. SCPEA4]MCY1061732.1 hypothetical protein [Nannocystis sp. SCPEA4]